MSSLGNVSSALEASAASEEEYAQMSVDYAETLFESIKLINESLMQDLHYDETIECTIIDASSAKIGEYMVRHDSVDFIAYSLEEYKEGANVYVTVPQGDYDKDKIITGKVMSNKEVAPFKYIAPFENFLDITGTLAPSNYQGATKALLANDPRKNGNSILVFKTDKLNEGYGYNGFTRLGISADFSSWLADFNCVYGDYGLRCEVVFGGEDSIENVNTLENLDYIKNMYLHTFDMIGNPYNFDGYFRQEKLFDITGMGPVKEISIYFEQKPGSFKDDKKNIIPCYNTLQEWDGNATEGSDPTALEYLPPNLFVQNVHVAIGFDLQDQEGEFVQLYTLDPLTYNVRVDPEVNKKHIHVRWVHETVDGKKYPMTQENTANEPYEIRWYRYTLGAHAADSYCGPNWEYFNNTPEDNNPDWRSFTATLAPSDSVSSESVKAIILYGVAPGYQEYAMDNGKTVVVKEDFEANPRDYYTKNADGTFIACTSRSDYSETTVYYWYQRDEREVYRTSALTFTNEIDVPSKATIEALSALRISCYDCTNGGKEDNTGQVAYTETLSYGNYLLYSEANELIDNTQSNIIRRLRWDLGGITDANEFAAAMNNITSISWIYPTKNTMIEARSVQGSVADAEFGEYKITKPDDSIDNAWQDNTYFDFVIKRRYSSSNANNQITCVVESGGKVFTAVQELTFGPAGTMGSDVTFVLDFVEDNRAIMPGQTMRVQALVYDQNNQLIPEPDFAITWEWYMSPSKYGGSNQIQFVGSTVNQYNIQISLAQNFALNSYPQCYILAAHLTLAERSISAYLPVPIRREATYNYISGADRIIYLSDGTPRYDSTPYVLYNQYGAPVSQCTWQLFPCLSNANPKNTAHASAIANAAPYLATLDTRSAIKPAPLYYDAEPTQYLVECSDSSGKVVWLQPIVVLHSRYFSSMINKWDGNTVHLDKEGGNILASRMGAGRKNSDNQFSGVLLGDWGKNTDGTISDTTTGLFGFRDGLLSFGFKDDGTAFIGTKTKGQLTFDGTQSTISSAAYRTSTGGGMELDFDNPKIIMRQGAIEDALVYTTTLYDQYEPYKKTSELNENLFMVIIQATPLYVYRNNTYTKVTAWDSSWTGSEDTEAVDEQLYQYYAQKEVVYTPVAGISTQAEFTEQCKIYNTNKLKTYDAAKKTYVTVSSTQFNTELYPSTTIWYHPSASTQTERRVIEIDATKPTNPFKIGDNFVVDWNGKLTASDGTFTGIINATSGTLGDLVLLGDLNAEQGTIIGAALETRYLTADDGTIGGWHISAGQLTSWDGQMYLNSYSNVIHGGTVEGSFVRGGTLSSLSGNLIYLQGYLAVQDNGGQVATLGWESSGIPGAEGTLGIGMSCSSCEVKATEKNAGLKCGSNYLSAEGGQIVMAADSTAGQLILRGSDKVTINGTQLELSNTASVVTILNQNHKFTTNGVELAGSALIIGTDQKATFAGAVETSSTLNVTGATTLSSTLAVTGATTLTGALTANGGITVNTLTANTKITVASLEVTGSASGKIYAVFG